MYAIDSKHGNIARILLEAGARADLVGNNGVLPIDLAITHGNVSLQTILSKHCSAKGFDLDALRNSSGGSVSYSQMENILLALGADDHVGLFKKHHIGLQQFLLLTEVDLKDMGIQQVGIRKKMIDAIADMHKREWQKSSVPKIQPRDKQKGLYFSAPDAALVIASIGQQIRFLATNVEFLNRQIRDTELLQLGNQVANAEDLARLAREAKAHIPHLNTKLHALSAVIEKKGHMSSRSSYLKNISIFTFLGLFFSYFWSK